MYIDVTNKYLINFNIYSYTLVEIILYIPTKHYNSKSPRDFIFPGMKDILLFWKEDLLF